MTIKILCAVDDTEHATRAITLAAQLAKAFGAELVLLAVSELMASTGGKGGIATYVWDSSDLKRILSNAQELAQQAGALDAKTASVKSRDVARAIVVYAEDNSVDHIVVGTGGKGGFSRLMLGSVSRDVVFRAHCPVTVAR